MVEFPAHPDDVTPAWLSGVLADEVSDIRWTAIGTGQVGDSVRFRFRDAAGQERTLAAKFAAADETSRRTAATFGLYAKEVAFYREIAPLLAVRVPEVHFAAIGADGADFILLFEDLGPARGGDQIAGCSLADAEAAIRQSAAIHAPSWHHAELLALEWAAPRPETSDQVKALYPHAHAIWQERYGAVLEPELMAVCQGVADAAETIFGAAPDPVSVVHGDFRLDNMLFDIKGGGEPIAILDWQTVTLGNPLTDIGYFMGCGIGNALRVRHERHLLDLYRHEMSARGVRLTHADIWDDYRRGAIHGITTAVFSAAFVERTERGDANFLSMARGACALALEHDSLSLV